MTHTADDTAFLAAICAAPDDDTPRVVYADWLDGRAERVPCVRCKSTGRWRGHCVESNPGTCDHCDGTGFVSDGRAEWAELIRVQCRIAAHPAHRYNPDATYGEYADLRARELELFRGMVGAGRASFGLPAAFVVTINQINATLQTPTDHTLPAAFVRRGFVDEICCTLAAWRGGACRKCTPTGRGYGYGCPACKGTGRTPGIAGDVVRAAPTVTRVVTDAEPWWTVGMKYRWNRDYGRPVPRDMDEVAARSVLPDVIYSRLKAAEHPDRYAAVDALSAALVGYGREAARAWPPRSWNAI